MFAGLEYKTKELYNQGARDIVCVVIVLEIVW